MSVRRLTRITFLISLLVSLSGTASASSRAAETTVLQVYFEGTALAGAGNPAADRMVVADFTRATGQPAKAVPSQDPVKILASIEGGTSPDLVMLGYVRPSWLYQGLAMPLDSYMKSSHFNLSKFTPTAWNQGYVNGHYYTMTSEQDTLVLLYNKDLFKRAGLDPAKPPLTFSQMESYAKKLTLYNADGSIKQLGLMPNYNNGGGGANYYQLWGEIFGGSFYDQQHKKTTAANPRNVEALTWLTNFWKTYGPAKLDRFEAGFGTYLTPNDPFARGKIAMLVDGDWWPFPGHFAKGFHLGVGYIPTPEKYASLGHIAPVFGDVMLIPKGSPHPDLAWKFINWYMNSEQEQLNLPNHLSGYPLLKSALTKPLLGAGGADPNVRLLEKILLSVHGRPNPMIMPITEKYMANLNFDADKALHGQESPLQALRHVDQVSQPELDQALQQEAG